MWVMIMLINDGGILYDEETAEILNSDDLSSHIKIKPVYLPYTQWRIKKVFEEAGYRLQPVYLGYKGLRYRPCQRYWIVDVETNEKLGTSDNGYSFEDLRYFLASCDIPLQGDKPKKTYRKDGRRQGCVEFLKIVESIGNSVDGK